MSPFHFCLSAAKKLRSLKLLPASLITDILQLFLGLPRLLFPWGYQSRAAFGISPSSFSECVTDPSKFSFPYFYIYILLVLLLSIGLCWKLSKFYLFTNSRSHELSLGGNIKIYIKIYIKTAPTCFGVTVIPSSGSALICQIVLN